jgi:hypothetical protein
MNHLYIALIVSEPPAVRYSKADLALGRTAQG